ncbi:putative FAD-binding PCMH-type domain-containing protein [Seiridium cardinale]
MDAMWYALSLVVSAWLLISEVDAIIDIRADLKEILDQYDWSTNTTITYPGTEYWDGATERWSVFSAPNFGAAISPATEEDAVQVVNIATSNNISFLATGGRHGFTTSLSEISNGIALDLSKFNSVSVNQSDGTMKIGGGVRFRDVYEPIFNAGYEMQIGTCSCPGIIGVTLGAGIGPYAGVHGFILDALLSVRLITADGSVVEASESTNPDLFWALRGAGANFGIVLSAEYQLQDQINNGEMLVSEFLIPAELNATYFELLESYQSTQPPNLSISVFMGYNSTIEASQIMTTWTYLGPQDEGLEVFQPMFDINPIVVDTQIYAWDTVIQSVAGGIDALSCTDNLTHIVNGANVRNLSASTYKEVFQKTAVFLEAYPGARISQVEISMYPNQAATAVPDDETAYPWRDARAYVSPQLTVDPTMVANSTLELAMEAFAEEIREDIVATSGYLGLAVYVNNAHGDETPEQIYSERKLPRLTSLKEKWDPNNVFRFYNPIITEGKQ